MKILFLSRYQLMTKRMLLNLIHPSNLSKMMSWNQVSRFQKEFKKLMLKKFNKIRRFRRDWIQLKKHLKTLTLNLLNTLVLRLTHQTGTSFE